MVFVGIASTIVLVMLGICVHIVVKAFSPTPLETYAEGGKLPLIRAVYLPNNITVSDSSILNAIVRSANAALLIPKRDIIELQRSVHCPKVTIKFADGSVGTGSIFIDGDSGFAFMPDSSGVRQLEGADYNPIFIPWIPGTSQELRHAVLKKFGEAAGYNFDKPVPPFRIDGNQMPQ